MTIPRNFGCPTDFEIWLRNNQELDSSKGFVGTDIDLVWRNYTTGEWLMIEEKCLNSKPKFYQEETFKNISKLCRADPKFLGFHLISFEKTSPRNGKVYLGINNIEITEKQLINFLQFKNWRGG
jgi:hypothetical protein